MNNKLERKEYEQKVVIVLGASNTGKTSILVQLCNKYFVKTHKTTYGADFYNKDIVIPNLGKGQEKIKLLLWDTCSDSYQNFPPIEVYLSAHSFIIVVSYDMLNPIDSIANIYENIKHTQERSRIAFNNKPVFIFVNKKDIKERKFNIDKIREYALTLKNEVYIFELDTHNFDEVQNIFSAVTKKIMGMNIDDNIHLIRLNGIDGNGSKNGKKCGCKFFI